MSKAAKRQQEISEKEALAYLPAEGTFVGSRSTFQGDVRALPLCEGGLDAYEALNVIMKVALTGEDFVHSGLTLSVKGDEFYGTEELHIQQGGTGSVTSDRWVAMDFLRAADLAVQEGARKWASGFNYDKAEKAISMAS